VQGKGLRCTRNSQWLVAEAQRRGRYAKDGGGSLGDKLNRAWIEFAASPASLPFVIDMRNVTEADAWGVQALRDFQSLRGARLITSSPLTKYVAEDFARHCAPQAHMKVAAVRRSRFHARKGSN